MEGGCEEYKLGGNLILKRDLKENGWEGVDWINLAQEDNSGVQYSQF